MYLTASILDIMQVVALVARFQYFPHESHVIVVKRVFKYLQGTTDYGLWYDKNKYFKLKAYTNVNWAGIIDDK